MSDSEFFKPWPIKFPDAVQATQSSMFRAVELCKVAVSFRKKANPFARSWT